MHRPFLLALAHISLVYSAFPGAEPTSQPYPIDWTRAHQTEVDLSRFLDGPAGKDGFLRVEDRRIIRPDGSRFRFWGVNVCGPDCFPSRDEAVLLAGDLARLGVNMVRFHHLDSNWGRSIFPKNANNTRKLDEENLDRFDYLVAQLKRWGIYVNINLNVLRRFREGDGVRDHELLGIGKGATYFNPRLIELQHEYARQLLTHRNPYTDTEYRHEPAVAVVEMVNENSMLEAWVSWRLVGRDDRAGDTWSPIPVSYDEELTTRYNRWLEARLTESELNRLRNESKAGPNGPVSRLNPDEFKQASRERFHAEARFYIHLEQDYFAGMKQLLAEELGVRSMLVGTADHNDSYSAFAHVQANLLYDVVDGHGYWEHPRLGQETWIKNTPMVNDPLDSTVVQFARTPIVGYPFTISEVNHPFPHEYACEGFPILTAYALFHDWDGIYWFHWGRGRREDPMDGIRQRGWFDFSNDPIKVTQLHTCALMWHRRDVEVAQETITRSYSSDRLIESLRDDRNRRPFFHPSFAQSTPLRHATRAQLGSATRHDLPGSAGLDLIESDTGQLSWAHADRDQGVVTVDTPRSQALVGFVRASERTTYHLRATMMNSFCAILLTSLDDRPIAASRRLLLSTSARMSNTGFEWREDRQTVAEWGRGPILVEPVTGTVELCNLGTTITLRVRPLAANGTSLPISVPATQTGEAWSIPLGEPTALWYIVEVER